MTTVRLFYVKSPSSYKTLTQHTKKKNKIKKEKENQTVQITTNCYHLQTHAHLTTSRNKAHCRNG